MIYCAIIGDIVKSRKLPDRMDAQVQFNNAINRVNEIYDKYLASNFTITLGDEFQGLLYKPHLCLEIIKIIKKEMAPIELVFGVGIGEIRTDIHKSVSIGSDGPAYHYARKMVERAKKKKPSICLCSNSLEDEIINSLLLFIESCVSSRTKKQAEVVKLSKEFTSQYKIADFLKKDQATISRILNKAFHFEVNSSEEKIVSFLKSKYVLE